MTFFKIYTKYHRYIHFLLHQYHITYNYEEYYQCLLIRLWELSRNYQASSTHKESSYYKYRLKYYLIDLLRKHSKSHDILSLDEIPIPKVQQRCNLDNQLSLNQLVKRLPYPYQQWFALYRLGYRQNEIEQKMNKSSTSIKKYKRETLYYLKHMMKDTI
ncbi:sigma-70 family RNA polymerase sigma factor [Staphylococcus canis]|uniref:Sigma-70 family RNA polymerase sigma factor n=1 Tax=Staphylococcus canis TaxID=2724942 RepID=A0ABS0TAD6_9STAP|nr:sigma-70 family RNA polymerase sigma factor [Staphylococcus canis]MBI5975692.1 sigma-70 family RNA polymerase sigma factor [Staphylococcus canis]